MHVDYIYLIETLNSSRDIPISFDFARLLREGETSRRAPSGKFSSLDLLVWIGPGLGLVTIFITYSSRRFFV
jgi:hypothetical protein